MYLHDEQPPAWVTDDGEVGRRIVRRRSDSVGAEVWWAVAEAVRRCREVTGGDDQSPYARYRAVSDALHATLDLAMLLPFALPLVEGGPPTWIEPAEQLLEWGPRTDVVNTTASALCAELDGDDWTCPDRLAGLVDDVVLALDTYRRAVRTIIASAPALGVA